MFKKNQKYLHIGCGDNVLPKPFINLDSRKRKGVLSISVSKNMGATLSVA